MTDNKSIARIADEGKIVELQRAKMRALFDGGLVPKGCNEKEVFARIVAGAELGMKPLQALNGIAMINGHPTLHSDSIPCIIMASGLVVGMKHKFSGEGDDIACTFYVKRKGVEEYQEWTYSLQDAKDAGLLNNPTWQKHLKKMLFNRARSWCLRNTFPDVIGNIYTKDEAEEIKPETLRTENPLSSLTPEERYAPAAETSIIDTESAVVDEPQPEQTEQQADEMSEVV